MELSDINALITGGSDGLGKATAKMIIDNGGTAVIAARKKERLQETADENGALPIQCDVSKEEEVIALMKQYIEYINNYNVHINNAGYGGSDKLVDLATQDMMDQFRTNTVGAMMVARES